VSVYNVDNVDDVPVHLCMYQYMYTCTQGVRGFKSFLGQLTFQERKWAVSGGGVVLPHLVWCVSDM